MYKMFIPLAVVVGTCLISCLAGTLSADSTFTVSSYIPQKFVDFEWRLGGGFRALGQSARLDPPPENGRSSGNAQDIDLTSSSIYRYRTTQRFLTWNMGSRWGYYHGVLETDSRHEVYDRQSDNSAWPALSTGLEFGQYCLSNFFISGAMKASWSYETYSTAREPGFKERGDYKGYSIDQSIYIGWGRSYEGQYSATALYIIEELRQNTLIEREPTYQEMLALTEIIYQCRLIHVIDARRHKIEALTRIMDFLLNRGIIDRAGPNEYLFTADVWDYFPRTSREFGGQLKFGCGFRYRYEIIQSTFTQEIEDWSSYHHDTKSYRMPYIAAIATYARPFSLSWQVTLYGDFTYVHDEEETTTHNYIVYPWRDMHHYSYGPSPISYCSATFYSALKYIYDSRTSGSFGPSFNIKDDGTIRTVLCGLGGLIEYRISSPTTLKLDWDLTYSHYGDNSGHDEHSIWNYDMTLDITHYLF